MDGRDMKDGPEKLPDTRGGNTARAIRSTLVGISANAALAVIKGIAGVVGNSYALIADAMESLLDIFHGIIVISGLTIAAVEPDDNHPYGHGKAEPLAATVAAIGILGAAIALAIQSARNLLDPDPTPPATFTLGVLVGVIAAKELLFRHVMRVGEDVESTAVRTDAWHHRSDALTSAAAFIGISVAVIGGEGYEKADDLAALAACAVIAWNGYRLLMPALGEVMDVAPTTDLHDTVRRVAREVPGVQGLDQCLVRKSGFNYFVDLHVLVHGERTVREGHDIAHSVKDALRAADPRVRDVLIHIEPYEAPDGGPEDPLPK